MVNILNLWKKNGILKLSTNKILEPLYIFLPTLDEVEKYAKTMQSNSSNNCVHRSNIKILNLFDPELQLINTKPISKKKIKITAKRVEKVLCILVVSIRTKIVTIVYCLGSHYQTQLASQFQLPPFSTGRK